MAALKLQGGLRRMFARRRRGAPKRGSAGQMIFGRKRRLMANQVPAIEAAGILRLLVEKDLVTRGEAAACLRGIANDLVAYGQLGNLGNAGRSYAAKLLERADEFGAAEKRLAGERASTLIETDDPANRPRLVWQN